MTTATRPSRSKRGSLTPRPASRSRPRRRTRARSRGRPQRERTSFASGTTSGQASAGTTGSPTSPRHSASLTSFPRYAVSVGGDAAALELLAQHRELVLDPADALDAHLPRARRHGVVRLRGDDEVVDADLVEAPQPDRVAARAGDALLAAVVRPHAVVGEHPVEVEDDEADRREVGHGSRAATGSPAGTRCSCVTSSSASSGCASVRPSSAVELVRRQAAVGGRLRDEVALGEHVPCRESARGNELLPHLRERPLLARQPPLLAVAERGRHALEVADEPAHPVGHQRERVIRALPGVVEREVLLEDARAEHVADERHRDPVVVVGEADHELRVALAQLADDGEVQILDVRRVGRRAVEDGELRRSRARSPRPRGRRPRGCRRPSRAASACRTPRRSAGTARSGGRPRRT